MRNCYIKDVFAEQWDDYQLKSIAFGGNQNLFPILKEYDLLHQSIATTYKDPAIIWYRKQHIAKMDCVLFGD